MVATMPGGLGMIITERERRNVLGLLNVSETARRLEIPAQEVFYQIRAGRLPSPKTQLGKRLYYHADDLPRLAELWRAIRNHP